MLGPAKCVTFVYRFRMLAGWLWLQWLQLQVLPKAGINWNDKHRVALSNCQGLCLFEDVCITPRMNLLRHRAEAAIWLIRFCEDEQNVLCSIPCLLVYHAIQT